MNGRQVAFVALRILVVALIASAGFALALTSLLAPIDFGASALDAFLLFYGGVAPVILLQAAFHRLPNRREATQAAVGALVMGFVLVLLPLSLAVQHEGRQLFGQFDWFAGVGIYLFVTAVCVMDLVWRRGRSAA